MTRMTGPECVVMCNFIITHTHTTASDNQKYCCRSKSNISTRRKIKIVLLPRFAWRGRGSRADGPRDPYKRAREVYPAGDVEAHGGQKRALREGAPLPGADRRQSPPGELGACASLYFTALQVPRWFRG